MKFLMTLLFLLATFSTASAQVAFKMGDINTNECTTGRALTLTECEQYGNDTPSVAWDGTEIDGDYPKGCYYLSSAIYFNYHATGENAKDSTPICTVSVTSEPPTPTPTVQTAPVFEQSTYAANVPEDTPINTPILTVVATDANPNAVLAHVITDVSPASATTMFNLFKYQGKTTGMIRVGSYTNDFKPLVGTAPITVVLTVEVTSDAGLSDTTTVTLTVTNYADCCAGEWDGECYTTAGDFNYQHSCDMCGDSPCLNDCKNGADGSEACAECCRSQTHEVDWQCENVLVTVTSEPPTPTPTMPYVPPTPTPTMPYVPPTPTPTMPYVPPTPTPTSNPEYKGCFADNGNRVFNHKELKNDGTLWDKFSCQTKCKGFAHFGIQYHGVECFCGLPSEAMDAQGVSTDCVSRLGGNWAIDVWVVDASLGAMDYTSGTDKTSLGCWKDNDNKNQPRIWSALHSKTFHTESIDECHDACKDWPCYTTECPTMFGLQFESECWCGMHSEDYERYGASTNCGQNGRGGKWAMMVYEITFAGKGRRRRD